jgi:hypothetical protein
LISKVILVFESYIALPDSISAYPYLLPIELFYHENMTEKEAKFFGLGILSSGT